MLKTEDLSGFTGSECIYHDPLFRDLKYTEGVRHVIHEAPAHWLFVEMTIANRTEAKVRREEFQVWTLKVNSHTNEGVLTCGDGNGKIVFTKVIPFTDFPLEHIEFYCIDNILLLPSEY